MCGAATPPTHHPTTSTFTKRKSPPARAAERCYDPKSQTPSPCTKASPAITTPMADDPAWCKAITAPTQVQHHEDTCIFIEPVRHSACQHSNTRGPGPQHAQSKWWKVEDSLPNERMTVVHILANTSITSGNTCCTHASIASVDMCTPHASLVVVTSVPTQASPMVTFVPTQASPTSRVQPSSA